MTVGIYVLKFKTSNMVYIGQSVNIELRYRVHKQKLKDNTHNYKMLNAYRLYGAPTIEVLCECSIEDLNRYELEAFEIYDSILNGLNIASEPNIHQEGEKNGASKYSNDQIRSVFNYLLDTSLTYKEIQELTDVKDSTVRHISNGESHTWLQRDFPEKYKIMKSINRRSNTNSAVNKGIVYPPVKSPEGLIHTVDNANAFARKYNMDSSYFIKLLNGKAQSCKGWTLVKQK